MFLLCKVVAAVPTLYRADSVEQGLSAQSVTLSSSLGEILCSASQEALRIEGRSADGILSLHANDRRESNGYATTSNGATVSDPVELFLSELKACDQIEDIMEMAIEESALMDGGSIAAAMLRCPLLFIFMASPCLLATCYTLLFLRHPPISDHVD